MIRCLKKKSSGFYRVNMSVVLSEAGKIRVKEIFNFWKEKLLILFYWSVWREF